MQRFDPVGDEFLQAPEVAVADAERFQVDDGVVEIFGAGADGAAGARGSPKSASAAWASNACTSPVRRFMRCSRRSESGGHALECCKALANNFRPFDPSLLADSVNGLLIYAGSRNLAGGDLLSLIVRKTA
jgi:hypothetical protein